MDLPPTQFPPASSPKRTRLIVLAAGIPVLLVPFLFQYIFIVNLFYFYGAGIDATLLANVIWHNDWIPSVPPWYSQCLWPSFHFTPLLALANGLSYLVPTHVAEYYGAFVAATYTLLAVAMYHVLTLYFPPRRLWGTLDLAALAIAFSFNGVLEQSVWVVHFEYAMPGFLFLFLVQFKRGNYRWSAVWLALALAVREDAGFHVTAILLLLAVIEYWRTRSLAGAKKDLIVAGIASLYSVLAWLMTGYFRSLCGASSQFQAVYTGSPAYAHLTWSLLGERALRICHDSPYLPVGAAVSIAWAFYRRNLYLLVGFTAFVPWFLLSWTAKADASGLLSGYYDFPFMLAMGWPILAIVCEYGRNAPRPALREALILQTVLVLIGLVVWDPGFRRPNFGPAFWARWSSYHPKWLPVVDGRRTDIRPRVRQAIEEITQSSSLGKVVADAGVTAFTLEQAPQIEELLHAVRRHARGLDTVVYFCPYGSPPGGEAWDTIETAASRNGLTRSFRARETDICLVTNRSPQELGSLAHLVAEQPFKASAAP